ncbi:LysR family transcriptional regulator [Puniceibacterium antarcticum]|nr:LysR family transcriptional regulator [Puniceibacterium antarcticum]
MADQVSLSTSPAAQDLPASPLARLRLLVALDALLVAGSVSGAARMLALSTPAMSRLLGQLRAQFDDPILVRSGQIMVPTPLASALRERVRKLSVDAEALIQCDLSNPPDETTPSARPTPVRASYQPVLISNRISALDGTENLPAADPRSRLARHVATVGGGAGRARALSIVEAEEAFRIVLDGDADPVQVGALLVAMQSRGTTADELAGMVRAVYEPDPVSRDAVQIDLDWPAYVSPRNRRAPFFLLAARALAESGHSVMLHGYNQGLIQFGEVLGALDIPVATSRIEAASQIRTKRISFVPLPVIRPQLQALINLYQLMDMRSPVNNVVQLINPLAARATILGVSSAGGLRRLQCDAAKLLGYRHLLCVESYRDVAQATPHRTVSLYYAETSGGHEAVVRIAADKTRNRPKVPPGFGTAEYCIALWEGRLRDMDAEALVTDTIALGLCALGHYGRDFAKTQKAAKLIWQHHIQRGAA